MGEKKDAARFSASKREFLKKMGLFTIYVGPIIHTFEMAEVTAKPTGPPIKKKKDTTGTVRNGRLPRDRDRA